MALPKVSPGLLPAENYRRFNGAFDAIDALDAQLDQEQTDRTAAVAAEGQARADGDTAINQRIDVEVRDRTAGIVAEGQARAAGDTALGVSLTQEAVVRDAGDRALQALLDLRRFEFLQPSSRPGDLGLGFTVVGSIAELQADASLLPLVPTAMRGFGDAGAIVRVTGSGIVATRARMAVEPGRVYRARFVVQRRANSSDPSNDTIRCGLVWFDQAGAILPAGAGSAFTAVVDLKRLTVSAGRTERQTIFARQAGAGTLIVAPRNARSVRAYVHSFGADPVTDIEVLQIDDVSNATILDALSADAFSRLTALESGNYGPRIAAVESATQNPMALTFASRSDAAAATIPATVTSVSVKGRTQAGDGRGLEYVRSATPVSSDQGFRSQDGAYWKAVLPLDSAFGGRPTVTDTGPDWASYSTLYNTLRVVTNGFPLDAQVGSNAFGFVETIVGAVDIPSTSKAGNHSAGVAGYARTASNDQGGVGVFGMASISGNGNNITGKSAWSFNSIITNAARHLDPTGFDNAIVYGGEWDVNLRKLADGSMPNAPLRMFYVIGDSNTMSKGIMRVFDIDTLGYYTPGVQWKEVLFTADGASLVGLNLGSIGKGNVASDGQPIMLRSRGAGGAGRNGQIQLTSAGDLLFNPFQGSGVNVIDTAGQIAMQVAFGLFKINADGQGAKQVTYGAADSAGSGFRTLRVPN